MKSTSSIYMKCYEYDCIHFWRHNPPPFGNQEMLFRGIMLLDYNLVSHLNYGHTDVLSQIGGCSLPQ